MKRAIYILAALAVLSLTLSATAFAQSGKAVPNSATGPCKATGTITYKFWGDKGEDIEQTAAIKAGREGLPRTARHRQLGPGNYDGTSQPKWVAVTLPMSFS